MDESPIYNLPTPDKPLTEDDVLGIVSSQIRNFSEPAQLQRGFFQSANFVTGVSGWNLTPAGNFEGNAGTFRGALQANSIDIPNTTTANSFHVNSSGDTWWGATTLGASVASITKAGVAKFSSATVKFGGDGSDGALAITSGTTTISLGSAAVVIKNYTSVSITGTATLAFSTPNTNGTIIILKSQGDVTLTSSSAPMIDASAMGAAGGNGGGAGSGGTVGSQPNSNLVNSSTAAGNGGLSGAAGGTGGIAGTSLPRIVNTNIAGKITQLTCGAGGGGGGGSTAGAGGAGARGGSALFIECAGSWNFTTTSGISVAGATGTNGTGGNSAGGGGGGGGGIVIALFNTNTANTGTITVSGGNVGTGSGGGATAGGGGAGGASQSTDGNAGNNGSAGTGGNGGQGGTGFSIAQTNTNFA